MSDSVASTMQDDAALTVGAMLRHGQQVYAGSVVRTVTDDGVHEATYAEVAERAARLAGALGGLGIGRGDRVGTFLWNTQEHLEAYLAVPSMGAVLHTLNLRLFPEQLAYVVDHGQDRVVLADVSVLPLLAKVADQIPTVEHLVLVGEGGDTSAFGDLPVSRYEDLLAAAPATYDWPELDERAPAAMCYTSGTTGNPKGVVYSHRSTWLHSLSVATANVIGLSEHDNVLPVVPMFHANAWGFPYAAWFAGSDLLMPNRFLQAAPLAKMISELRPTVAGAVPTIWNDLLGHVGEHPADLSSLRMVTCGGAAVPESLMRRFEDELGVRMVQAWGMTETSPVAAIAHVPRGQAHDAWRWRAKTGRVMAGVELRLVDDAGTVLPWDGEAVGEVQVRGPWVTASYHLDPDPAKFSEGWLRTGDVAVVFPNGMVQITDRSKDVIKSGGEWISSVELENELMAHPSVREAAVVAVPDPRWDERPLACVVLAPGASASPQELTEHLSSRVARWWLPERWTYIDEVPRTSVGKFDKKVLRKQYADGLLEVQELQAPAVAGR